MMKTDNNVSLILRQGYYFSKICVVEITQKQTRGKFAYKDNSAYEKVVLQP